jgi:outer membrane receptor protein involved in Fe transport
LNENTFSGNLNYERLFKNSFDTTKFITFKTGAYAESKNRNFSARWMSYSYTGDPSLKNDFLKTPIDQIFDAANMNATSGFKLQEGTNPSDKYTANNQLGAAYVNFGVPIKRTKLNAGLRTEYFNQTLNSATNNGPVNVKLTNLNVLPSFNAAFYLDSAADKTLVRFGYGRTVNRPEFRELAPFVYYDFMYDVNIVGNENLKSATINNFDLRFETYPTSGETFSVGLFYKNFTNPIENYVQPVGLSQQFTLKNAAKATNYGLELELRRDFKQHSQNHFIQHLSTLFNASYIISKVDLGNDSTLSQARTRPLQGQSPYIINAALQYATDSGLTINLTYNIIGKRIAYVGNNIFPTVYEMPRHSLDLTFIKEINKVMTIKLGVSDILNYKHQLWQDTNNDGKIDYNKDRTDNQLLEYRRGQMINFGISFKFK